MKKHRESMVNDLKYPFYVYYTQEGNESFWVAKSSALNGCVGQGDSPEEALAELEENEQFWLETAEEVGIQIPSVPVEHEQKYSGKFTVRVSPMVHKDAIVCAKIQGISLNQYVNDSIVAQNAKVSTLEMIIPEIKQAVKDIFFGPTSTRSGDTMLTQFQAYNKRIYATAIPY